MLFKMGLQNRIKTNEFAFIQSLALQQHSGYKAADLKECVEILHSLQSSERAKALIAIREKYKQYKVCILPSLCMYCC